MTKENKDTIIQKIQKCFLLADSANENEAAVATRKAQELLEHYNLTMVDLASFEKPSEILTSDISVKGRHESWTGILLCNLAKTFDCQGFSSSNGNGRTQKVVGFPADIEVFTYTFNYLLRVITALYKKELVKEKAKSLYWSRRNTYAFKSGFCMGCSTKIVERIKEDRDRQLQSNVDSRDLVLTKSKSVSTWVKDNLKLRTKSTRYNPTGYSQGVSAANGISLHKVLKSNLQPMGALG